MDLKMHMNMEEIADAGMMPGGSLKDLKLPSSSSDAGNFDSHLQNQNRTHPTRTFLSFLSPISHTINDADLTVRNLWHRICGSLGTGSLFTCHELSQLG